MKNFLVYTIRILILAFLIAVFLDCFFTFAFLQSKNRGKIDYVYNSKERNYDVVILGSSRAHNHFVSQMFEEKGFKTFNYGMSASHLLETDLLLKLMIERHYKIKNIILEADLNLANEMPGAINALYLPYIHNSETIREHFEQEPEFRELYYIPFYRYIKFETIIGIREMFCNLINKKINSLNNLGYRPLGKNPNANMKNNIANLNPLPHNKYYEEIKNICKVNNINLITVMTPMCENVTGMNYFEKVKKAYPEIYNYENVVVENKYFSSCGHMNDSGARLFTARILKDFFNK